MKKITRLIEVRLGTGLWEQQPQSIQKHLSGGTNSVKNSAKTLETTIITVSNEQVNVLAKGTENK